MIRGAFKKDMKRHNPEISDTKERKCIKKLFKPKLQLRFLCITSKIYKQAAGDGYAKTIRFFRAHR